ncbi:hypothetical protein [Tunturibacter empetritectus]|uniref:Uncharacterized protein n=1 Tax=Tunturiibacter empetritectus TaxID=3069691 RepID=A0A7W8IJ81_9BACT|nr:hypothetical protein [Edaphobacter lichenicola]MBB5318125.1 hypothetical protein [Edaphobacter lichenicola]
MKKIIGAILQFLLFLFAFTIGSFAHPFNLHWGLTVTTPTTTRYFVVDGLILITVLFALILLIEALTKHLRPLALWTTVAFVLATIVGFVIKLGFVTHEIY